MVFLGLPHGALDHLAPLFLVHRRLTPHYLLLFVLGYGALVAAYLLLWRLWPPGALAVFLLLSWLHWGQGDAYFLERLAGRPAPPAPAGRLLVWLVRGGLPIVLPVLVFPAVFAQVAGGILGWYGGPAAPLLSQSAREWGLAAGALAAAAYLWQSRRLGRRGFGLDAAEIGLLAVYFSVVPPILAVGVYFCVWHAARHLARLLLIEDANLAPLACGDFGRPLRRMTVRAVPMTAGALTLLGGLLWMQARISAPTGVGGLVYLYLSLIAALTFPHFLLVLWMDRRERVGEELVEQGPDAALVGGRGDAVGNRL